MKEFRKLAEFLYIGTYHHGIHILEWERASGRFRFVGTATDLKNPSFLAFHPRHDILYAADEYATGAQIAAFRLDAATGLLSHENSVETAGTGLCHLAVAPDGGQLAAACYNSGDVVCVSLDDDGLPLRQTATFRGQGSGPHPRQTDPHAHQVIFTPDSKKLVAVDLGLDRLFVFAADGNLSSANPPHAILPAGEGPRHLLFSPCGAYAYVLSELANNILCFTWDGDTFALRQSISVLEPGHDGSAGSAELQISPDGRFLYASVRGPDTIVRFDIAADGSLARPAWFSAHGKSPRMFIISDDGTHMFITHQDSGSVVALGIGPDGTLSAPLAQIAVPNACCVLTRHPRKEPPCPTSASAKYAPSSPPLPA